MVGPDAKSWHCRLLIPSLHHKAVVLSFLAECVCIYACPAERETGTVVRVVGVADRGRPSCQEAHGACRASKRGHSSGSTIQTRGTSVTSQRSGVCKITAFLSKVFWRAISFLTSQLSAHIRHFVVFTENYCQTT